jgi:hypothetical protein
MLGTQIGELQGDSFCKLSSPLTVNPTHKLFRYPFAYSFMVLPLSIARWSAGDHKPVPSVALFIGFATFSLSGVVNVSMFWIIRRGRLLFAPSEETLGQALEPEIGLQVTPRPNSVISSNTANDVNDDPRASMSIENII